MPASFLAAPPFDHNEPSGIRIIDAESVAETALAEGEALLARDLLEGAAERFQAALKAYELQGDPAGAARALLGLGRVLLGLENPACREVLEDAGTALEDLGDEAGMRCVDQLLRAADSSMPKASPRSFHSSTMLKAALRSG